MNNMEMIEVLNAAEDDKPIECRRIGVNQHWYKVLTRTFEWDFMQYDYRVKPEPLHCYGSISVSGHIGPVVHLTIAEAEKARVDCWGDSDSIIKFIAAPDEEQQF